DRGKVLSVEDLNRLGLGGFKRYKDTDGDGIAWRTLPGTEHPFAAYFTRGTGHNDEARLSERPEDWENNMARLARKFETARTLVPKPVEERVEGAEVGIIGYGSTDTPIIEARHMLQGMGCKTSYMRVRALPLSDEVTQFVHAHKHVYVVEMNSDGQMCQLLRLHVPEMAVSIRPCNHSDGMPLTAKWISTAILEKEKK
ncbi:MAG TPA: 2-oxoacid:acceptor oxidoreductase subunit alpha, partial [Anaerolineae bacterium]